MTIFNIHNFSGIHTSSLLLSLVYAGMFLSIIAVAPINYASAQEVLTAAFVGDISCNSNGISTIESIKADNPDVFIILGDMSYGPSVGCFSNHVKDLKSQGVTVRCDIGNHDSQAEETDALEKLYWNLCAGGTSRQGFWKLHAGAITILGINTQCDGNRNHTATEPPCDSRRILKFLKSVDRNTFVVATAHKPLCDSPKSKSPAFECDDDILEEFDRIGVTTTIGADNHCSAYNEGKFIAGSGGRSHYSCSGWDWIDDTKYAYLFMVYKDDKLDFVFKHFKTRAEISPHFLIDSNENQEVLPGNTEGNTSHTLINTVEGTVEFKDKNGTIYYQIPTVPGVIPIPNEK
jgi:Calcineurin-like phosphoesterase